MALPRTKGPPFTEAVLERLDGVKKTGAGSYMARCPCHDDRSPSLHLTFKADAALAHCMSGCDQADVLARLRELDGCTGEAFVPVTMSKKPAAARVVAEYDYTDENGEALYQVVRMDPKDFRQRHMVDGQWEWKLNGVRRVLYQLPDVVATAAAGGTVYVCEGEKDCDAIAAMGAVATCNPGGAGKWQDEYSAVLTGAHVVIVRDKDEPGRKHAAAVRASVRPHAASVRVVEAREGKDAFDHIYAGFGLADFKRADDIFIDWSTFWCRDASEAEWVFQDVLARGRGHALYAARKLGKSLLMLSIAAQVATSSDDVVVVYLDYEMTEADIFDRLEDMGYGAQSDLSRLRYALLPALPPLDTEEGAAALMDIIDGVEDEFPGSHVVTIFDTISRAVCGEENSADTFRAFYTHTGIELKRRGITWARLDHSGHSGEHQRGSSSKGDDVDVVWKLTRTENGITLHRDLARMPWVPAGVTFGLFEEPLRYVRLVEDWPAGTRETAADLDRLDVPSDASIRSAKSALKAAGCGRRTDVVSAAQKWRRETRGTPRGTLSDEVLGTQSGNAGNTPLPEAGNTAGNSGEH